MRRIDNRSGLLKSLGGWLALPLAILSFHAPCRAQDMAQDIARCGHGTVEDAWGPTVASEAKAFLVKLQRIVRANDKKQFASVIHYPVLVWYRGHSAEISSPSEFVAKYSSIVTPNVRHAILAESPECLFGNGQGMMVGRGQVWFQKESGGDMKIITIDSIAPRVDK
jgi:hypothetical protein